MNIDELREKYKNKHVRTERELSAEEFDEWMGSDGWMSAEYDVWHSRYMFSGEGIVAKITEIDGKIWLEIDDSHEWVIDEHTKIEMIK